MENVITLDKLIGLLFCLPSSLLFFVENSKNTRNELARPVMGTIFLVVDETNRYGRNKPNWLYTDRDELLIFL